MRRLNPESAARAAEWRRRAAFFRDLAATAPARSERLEFLALTRQWDALARAAEAGARRLASGA